MRFLLHEGYRVIAHDRRGHGRSSQSSNGREMDIRAHRTACARAGRSGQRGYLLVPRRLSPWRAKGPRRHKAMHASICLHFFQIR
jgi:pimeloyl-ACP methyl ester carboxylesterase